MELSNLFYKLLRKFWSILKHQNLCLNLLALTDFPVGFLGGAVLKNLPANAGDSGDVGSIPSSGRSPGVVNGNTLQYSCLRNPMDQGALWATVHGVTKSQIWLNTHSCLSNMNFWFFPSWVQIISSGIWTKNILKYTTGEKALHHWS